MKRSAFLLVLLIALFGISCIRSPRLTETSTPSVAVSPTPLSVTARQRIKTISDYIVYYGTGRVDDLARYDLAIIQPETLTAEELTRLKAQGTLVVAYLSVGEAEPGRPWYTDGRWGSE